MVTQSSLFGQTPFFQVNPLFPAISPGLGGLGSLSGALGSPQRPSAPQAAQPQASGTLAPLTFEDFGEEGDKLAFFNALNYLPFFSQIGAPETQQRFIQAHIDPRGTGRTSPGLSQFYEQWGNPEYWSSIPYGAARRKQVQGILGQANQLQGGGLLPTQGRGSNVKRFFQNQFSNIFDEYRGRLGGQIAGGGEPTLGFDEFLAEFPFLQRFQNLAPSLRGETGARFAPQTRFAF